MALPISIILGISAIILLIVHYFYKLRVPKNFPPGPFLPVPLLTRIPFTRYYGLSHLRLFEEIQKDYGKTYSVHLGHMRVVMMSDYEDVRDVFAKKINQRPVEVLSHWRDHHYGVIFTNGDSWKQQRKMFMETLKETGFEKGQIERSMDNIWPRISQMLIDNGTEKLNPKAFELLLTEMVINVFSDPSVFPNGKPSQEVLELFNITRTFGIQWCEFEMWYRYPFMRILAPDFSGYTKATETMKKGHDELNKIIQMHKDQPVDEHQRRDFIDVYLEKLAKYSNDPQSLFYGDSGRQCAIATLDNILVGCDGIFLAFNTVLYVLGQYPEVQQKMRAEIRDVLRDGHPLSLADKKRLPYCEAVVMEVQRLCAQSGFGAGHQCEETVEFNGYVLPAGTEVFPNMYYILHDEKYWDQPEEFRPERFIDDNGKCFVDPRWIPFELGSRMCPGRNFAMDVLMLLTERLISDFEFSTTKNPRQPSEYETTIKQLAKDTDLPLDDLLLPNHHDDEDHELIGMALILPKSFSVSFSRIQKESTDLWHQLQYRVRKRSIA